MTTKPDSETGSGTAPDHPESEGGVVEMDMDGGGIAIEIDSPVASGGEPTDRIAELEARVAELEAKDKETYDRLLRTTADLDNFRKRTRREMDQAKTEARAKTLLEMLPVVDNLERAVAHADTATDAKAIADGVNLVLRQFAQAFERLGVTPLEAVGKPFDPNVHEAVSQMATAEHPPGTVVAELQKGYTIGDRLLRPTLAVVSAAAAAATDDDDDEPSGPNGHDRDPSSGAPATGEDPGT